MSAKQTDPLELLSDEEVLALTGHGHFGPGIVGPALHARSEAIIARTGGGQFGPALTDPHYAAKQRAARQGQVPTIGEFVEREDEEQGEDGAIAAGEDAAAALDPWEFVTLSGAKLLAQQHGVSYRPGVKRGALVTALQGAGIQPPPPPSREELAADDAED